MQGFVYGLTAAEFSEAAPLSVFGVGVTVLRRAEQTGGAYSVYALHVPPGAGAPPHVHRADDEAFFVLSGAFEVTFGGETITAGAGEFVSLPRGIAHAFRCVGDTAGRLLGIASPGGHERFFEDAHALFAAGPPAPPQIGALLERHGMEIVQTEG